jgi:hypothetical protein
LINIFLGNKFIIGLQLKWLKWQAVMQPWCLPYPCCVQATSWQFVSITFQYFPSAWQLCIPYPCCHHLTLQIILCIYLCPPCLFLLFVLCHIGSYFCVVSCLILVALCAVSCSLLKKIRHNTIKLWVETHTVQYRIVSDDHIMSLLDRIVPYRTPSW